MNVSFCAGVSGLTGSGFFFGAVGAAKAALEAKLKALPVLSEIDGLDEKLEPFSSWPAQLDIDPEDLVRMLTDQAKAQSSVKKLGEEIDGLHAELLEVEHHPEHLALSKELNDLDSLRSRYATAELDLDRRVGQRARNAHDIVVVQCIGNQAKGGN